MNTSSVGVYSLRQYYASNRPMFPFCFLTVPLSLFDSSLALNSQSKAHRAARTGDIDALKQIVATDPTAIYLPDKNNWTPLHEAVSAGQIDSITFLLENGANVNAATALGATPLLEAYVGYGKHSQIYKVIRQHGGKLIEPYDEVRRK